jgi:hypothetical protein
MDTVLIAVTALSLMMAVGMAVVVAKLLRADRERSDARVAALAVMASRPLPLHTEIAAQPAPHESAAKRRPSYAAATVPLETNALSELELRPERHAPIASGGLFAAHDAPSPWDRRLFVIGSLTAVLAAAIVALTTPGRHVNGTATPAAVAQAVTPVPLELVALRHKREAESLTISGLVQNPKSGVPQSRLVATAFVFGPDGAFLTSSRAPIDIRTLAPGDESPFVVTVPVNGDVSRYRIGFRTEDGAVVAHVDKRTPDTLASKQEQP